MDQALACAQQACKLKPDENRYHSGVLGTLHYHPHYDCRAIMEEHRRWEAAHALPVARSEVAFANDPSPGRRLRIGYSSPDFRDHAVGRNIWPLISNQDHSQFEVALYADLPRADPMTQQFQKCADVWCNVTAWPDEQLAARIEEDRIDILVDLALHTGGNRLLVFARKPAPVQVTFAGYPGTTGLRAIDYRLTDPYLDPPGLHDDCYSEESYRLPHTFWCFDPQTEEPAVGPLPALEKAFVTFGCLNNFCKINDDVLRLWARVLSAVPKSRLLLLAKGGSHRQRTIDFLADHGIGPERVDFVSPKPRPEYLALYNRVDLGLDTFPYNGHTTSLDSFWMGVPVITLVGKTVVGRAGLSQLTNLGLEELATITPEDFVRVAANWANDWPKLEAMRNGLRDRMRQSPLMDSKGFARGIEEAYRSMWHKWCAAKGGRTQLRASGGSTTTQRVFHLAEDLARPRCSLYKVFRDLPAIKVIDVGASPIDGPPPYQRLFDAGRVNLVGFEPDPDQHRALVAHACANATFLPYAIGDGSAGTLHICKLPGMTSLLEPDMEILRHFHGFGRWGTVLRTMPVQTRRLDDIPEVDKADYIKLDLQGGELSVLRGASKVLEHVLVVHIEVQFVPFYKDQPLFAELDQALRQAGFFFHRFLEISSRVFFPLMISDKPKASLSQQLWSDAVYVKRFTDFARQDESSLLKIAAILNDLYGSIDLCALALQHADRRANTRRTERYCEALSRGL
jgi:FkbM family methyltransferase